MMLAGLTVPEPLVLVMAAVHDAALSGRTEKLPVTLLPAASVCVLGRRSCAGPKVNGRPVPEIPQALENVGGLVAVVATRLPLPEVDSCALLTPSTWQLVDCDSPLK